MNPISGVVLSIVVIPIFTILFIYAYLKEEKTTVVEALSKVLLWASIGLLVAFVIVSVVRTEIDVGRWIWSHVKNLGAPWVHKGYVEMPSGSKLCIDGTYCGDSHYSHCKYWLMACPPEGCSADRGQVRICLNGGYPSQVIICDGMKDDEHAVPQPAGTCTRWEPSNLDHETCSGGCPSPRYVSPNRGTYPDGNPWWINNDGSLGVSSVWVHHGSLSFEGKTHLAEPVDDTLTIVGNTTLGDWAASDTLLVNSGSSEFKGDLYINPKPKPKKCPKGLVYMKSGGTLAVCEGKESLTDDGLVGGNIAVGYSHANDLTTGDYNVAIGYKAGATNTCIGRECQL